MYWEDKYHIHLRQHLDEFKAVEVFEKVKGKQNVAIIATTTDGNTFGEFYSVAVTDQDKTSKDLNMFIFSFESHRRFETPQRFSVKEKWMGDAGVWFDAYNWYGWFVRFDGALGWVFLGNEKSKTFCVDPSRGFENIFF